MSVALTSQLVVALGLGRALLPDSMPEPERVKRLAPYFVPPPGTELRFDEAELKGYRPKNGPMTIRGFIIVKPPRGTCFILKRRDDVPDLTICERQTVAFDGYDLGETGDVRWWVMAGQGDFGTELTWSTPYRKAQYVGWAEPGAKHPTLEPILACEADRRDRSIKLTLASGAIWKVALPPSDKPLPQPGPVPNLYVVSGAPVITGLPSTAAQAAANEHGTPPPPPAKPKEEVKGKGKEDEAPKSFVNVSAFTEPEEKGYTWLLTERNTFVTNSSALRVTGAPPGMNGECRYRYEGALSDPESGAIECQRTDIFEMVYAPLTCAKALKPR